MKLTPQEKRITDMIEPIVADHGLSLVSVRISGDSGMATLQVLAENPATRNLGLEDCAKLSRELAATLDVEDPIKGAYRLEVSSPGIDRPLTKEQDFRDFADNEIKVEIFPPLGDQKRFRGLLKGIENGAIQLETETGPASLPLESIQKARLVLTDELLKKTKDAQAADPSLRHPRAGGDPGDQGLMPDIMANGPGSPPARG
jgi:ribosome maturation factor RimP